VELCVGKYNKGVHIKLCVATYDPVIQKMHPHGQVFELRSKRAAEW
jgi:hypothetical protein